MSDIRIMIVEDDRLVAEDIKQSLTDFGYRMVGLFAAGEEALEKVDLLKPDLILMDVVLPGEMNGIETAACIRANHNIPLIYLTSYSDETTLGRAKAAEPFGYIVKPFTERDLKRNIEMALYRHRIEQKLHANEQWLSTILRSIGDAVITTDNSGCITFMNPPAELMTGCKLKNALGKEAADIFTIIDEITRKPLKNLLSRVQPKKETGDLSNYLILQTSDNREISIDDSVAPIIDDNGNTSGTVLVLRDITKQIQACEEQKQLEQRNRQAEKFESLNIMAGSIAHNFNNLLMGVLGNLHLAADDLSPDSPIRKSIDSATEAARRAAKLSSQMLTYVGQRHYSLKTIDLTRLMENIINLLTTAVPDKIRLELKLAAQPLNIQGDPGQIRQVIMSVVTNAAEAIQHDNGQITISSGVVYCVKVCFQPSGFDDDLSPGNYIFLEITDTGSGMDEETLSRIFDPFFTTKFTGRGLGLAAVLGIVRAHKGAVQIKSKPNQGTSFRLYLPETPVKDTKSPKDVLESWKCEGAVLLVEDEDIVRRIGKRLLEHLGFEVYLANDGNEAVQLFQKYHHVIRCVILDWSMPEMDGGRTLSELLKIQNDVKVIFTSGFSEAQIQAKLGDFKAAGFIQKPFQITKLAEIIKMVIEGGESDLSD